MPARKAKVEMYWSTEKKSKEEIAAEKAADKAKGIVWKGTAAHWRQVINWRLVGANGEIMCGSTQGFTSREDVKRSIARCGELLWRAHPSVNSDTVKGPGRKPPIHGL